jgi:hypothetical protein
MDLPEVLFSNIIEVVTNDRKIAKTNAPIRHKKTPPTMIKNDNNEAPNKTPYFEKTIFLDDWLSHWSCKYNLMKKSTKTPPK